MGWDTEAKLYLQGYYWECELGKAYVGHIPGVEREGCEQALRTDSAKEWIVDIVGV